MKTVIVLCALLMSSLGFAGHVSVTHAAKADSNLFLFDMGDGLYMPLAMSTQFTNVIMHHPIGSV